jgi:hypothetical protein
MIPHIPQGGLMNMRIPLVNTARYRRRRWPRPQYDHTMTAPAPTAPFGGGIGKGAYTGVKSKKSGLNWEEISEVMSEMQMMEPEFIPGGSYGRTQEYAVLPYSFDEAGMAEIQKRKKLYPFLA